MNYSTLNADEKLSYTAVENGFNNHLVGNHNIISERAKFNMHKQEPGKSAYSFITATHKLAEYCNFGPLKDELIRDTSKKRHVTFGKSPAGLRPYVEQSCQSVSVVCHSMQQVQEMFEQQDIQEDSLYLGEVL